MRTLSILCLLSTSLIACSDNEYVCADVIEAGDDMTGLSNRDDFIGVDTCYYAFADPKGCEDDGGTPYVMDEMNGTSATCPENGYGVQCGGTELYVQQAEDCPEGYDVTE